MRFDFAFELSGVGERVAIEFFFYRVQNFAGGFDAEIGGEQGSFEMLERGRIDLLFAEENVVDGFGERGLGLGNRGFEAFEQRPLSLFHLFGFAKQ